MSVRPFLLRALERAEHRNTELQQRLDEQRRLASDLSDDLGPSLMALVQAGQTGTAPDRIATLARKALQDMRLSVRGLTAPAATAQEVLADWRAECVEALAGAAIEVEWDVAEPPEGTQLPARSQVQLTRILREAVANVIRHSGAKRCWVRIRFVAGALRLEVSDDGHGLASPSAARSGLGLAQVERRARQLGGTHRLDAGPLGGLRLLVEVPVPVHPEAQAA